MEALAEELINAKIGPFLNPGLLLAAAASFFVLISGLGAKIIEAGQATAGNG